MPKIDGDYFDEESTSQCLTVPANLLDDTKSLVNFLFSRKIARREADGATKIDAPDGPMGFRGAVETMSSHNAALI